MAGPLAEVEKAVKRPHWEPRHEWESRVKFVEDNVADYGLEKAVALSIVWGNMMFLGCSYPPGTERLVSSYPVPPLEELKARRKAKQSLKRGLGEDDSQGSPKRTKLDDTPTDVSSLISSIRSQSERDQQGGGFIPQYNEKLSKAVPRSIQAVANAICLCKDCIGCEGVNERATRLLQKYSDTRDNTFQFEFREETVPQAFAQKDGYKCTLLINGESIIEKLVALKKESKASVSAAVLKMADDWQEAHGKPACPSLAQCEGSQPQQGTEEYDGGYQSTPSRNTYNQGRGNSYNYSRGDHYSRQSPSQDRSRYNSSDYFMPPSQSAGRSGRGNGGHGYGSRGNDGHGYGGRVNDVHGYGGRVNDGHGYGGRGNDGHGYGSRGNDRHGYGSCGNGGRGHGYGGRGNGGGGYQYGSPRYY